MIDHPESLAPRERLAIEYTRAAMANSNAIPQPLAGQLHEHFADPELVELTFLIGYINMLNLFNNCLEVRYNGEYALLKSGGRLTTDRASPTSREGGSPCSGPATRSPGSPRTIS